MAKGNHGARWVEGLDWIRVENTLDPDFGGSPEIYTALLAAMMEYLPDADPDLMEVIHAEATRRRNAGKMSDEQAHCYLEALQRSVENDKRLIAAAKETLRRGHLHVVRGDAP